MNKNLLILLSIAFLTGLLLGCQKKTSEETQTYSDAWVTSLTFAANDSFPGLKKASFSIVTSSDTGYITTKDSLMYGTKLDSVVPYLTFSHTPSYAIFYSDSDTIIYSGKDTINMSPRPVRLYVMASDKKTGYWYEIYTDVHQVDPDLFTWQQLTPAVFTEEAECRAVRISETFYLFTNDGFCNRLYTSINARKWSEGTVISDLPASCRVQNIMAAGHTIYYADGDKLYHSTDGEHWQVEDYSAKGFTLLNMLYQFNDSVWAIAQRSDAQLQLANMAEGGEMRLTGDILPESFPVSDFAALTFASASQRKRAMIVGGFDIQGNSLNTRWNVEYMPGRGYKMIDFSIEQPSYASLTGVSIVWYNHMFHMFGSADDDAQVGPYTQLISSDEGMNWILPDTTKNHLPVGYIPRHNASVLTDETHHIYIIGGRNRTQAFADVWCGHLNKTSFADYQE